MCTNSPGEQSLARRVKPTISAYSILQIKQTNNKFSASDQHRHVQYNYENTQMVHAWRWCVSARRGCESYWCSPSGQSLDPSISGWSQLSWRERCGLAAVTRADAPVTTETGRGPSENQIIVYDIHMIVKPHIIFLKLAFIAKHKLHFKKWSNLRKQHGSWTGHQERWRW